MADLAADIVTALVSVLPGANVFAPYSHCQFSILNSRGTPDASKGEVTL